MKKSRNTGGVHHLALRQVGSEQAHLGRMADDLTLDRCVLREMYQEMV